MLLPLQNFSFLIKDLNHHYSGFKNAVVKVRGLEKLFVSKTNIEIFDFLELLLPVPFDFFRYRNVIYLV